MATPIEQSGVVADFLKKLNSDRLWALILFIVVVVVNAKLSLGIEPGAMQQLLYAVIAFILGKSWRSTVGPQATSLLRGIDADKVIATFGTATATEHAVSAPRPAPAKAEEAATP